MRGENNLFELVNKVVKI